MGFKTKLLATSYFLCNAYYVRKRKTSSKLHKAIIPMLITLIIGSCIVIAIVSFTLLHNSRQYPTENFIGKTTITLTPTFTPTASITSVPYIAFDPAQCSTEGSEIEVNQALRNQFTLFEQGKNTNIPTITLWEPDAYAIADIYSRDLIQSTNPSLTVYTSICTKDYLITSSMGGGPANVSIVNASSKELPWGVTIDFDQIQNSIPFAAVKLSPETVASNPLVEKFTTSQVYFTSNEGAYVLVKLGGKTFPATSYQVQINYLKDRGLTYTYLFYNSVKLTAKVIIDKTNSITSFQVF